MSLLLLLALAATPHPWESLSAAERRAKLEKLSHEELETMLRETPPAALLRLSEKTIAALGPYEYLMVKQERVRGTLLPEQTIRTTIRESPSAIRLDFLKGPGAGRRVIYNASVKTAEFKVREAGFLAFLPVWLPLDSPMAKSDSNRTVVEAGLGTLVRRLAREQGRAEGSVTITHEGWRGKDEFCSVYALPDGGRGFDHARTRVCVNPRAGVPTLVEGFDDRGTMLERYAFSGVKAVTPGPATFDPEKGL